MPPWVVYTGVYARIYPGGVYLVYMPVYTLVVYTMVYICQYTPLGTPSYVHAVLHVYAATAVRGVRGPGLNGGELAWV